MSARILGIDPGLRVTGYGAVERIPSALRVIEAGVITPPTDAPLEQRLHVLHEQASEVIAAVRPEIVVIEELWSSYKNPTTAVLMGHARGVLCLAAYAQGVAVRHLAHAMVKRVLAGSGAARKEQVNRMVMQQLRLRVPPRPNDVSDALALALTYAHIERSEERLERLGLPTAK